MKYNINNNNLSKIFLAIKSNIEGNKTVIEELLKIDYKYCNFKVNTDIFIEIINKLQNEKLDVKKEQKIVVHYNGNPYLTLNLSILAIITKTTIFLEFDEYMLGINTFITDTVNNILKEFQTDNLIYILKRNDEINQNVDKIVCIDDINKYNSYLYKNNEKAKFYALNYIDFYSDSDEFEELTELIYKYSENNLISFESYSEFGVNQALQMMQNGLGQKVVLLTDNEETKKKFIETLTGKKIYINENPFERKVELINSKILYI